VGLNLFSLNAGENLNNPSEDNFYINTGDMARDGTDDTWGAFMKYEDEVLRKTTFWTSPGNHDPKDTYTDIMALPGQELGQVHPPAWDRPDQQHPGQLNQKR